MAIPSFINNVGALRTPSIVILNVNDRREPDRFIDRVIVERSEAYERDSVGNVISARIELNYDVFPGKGVEPMASFAAAYCGISNTLKLVAGALFMDVKHLEGQRIGTYLMSNIVEWARQWPSARVQSIELNEGQGIGQNKVRRNRLYEQLGLRFKYDDDRLVSGRSIEMPAGELKVVATWRDNIQVVTIPEFLKRANYMEQELDQSQIAISNLVKEKRESEIAPLRWAAKLLWRRHYFSLTLFGLLGIVGWISSLQ